MVQERATPMIAPRVRSFYDVRCKRESDRSCPVYLAGAFGGAIAAGIVFGVVGRALWSVRYGDVQTVTGHDGQGLRGHRPDVRA